MAEYRVIKLNKLTDFQAHMMEHQLGAYTDCNHGAGLAVLHPALYRHICEAGAAKFARFARNVWGIEEKATELETARAGVAALADFIKEIGLPTTLRELGVDESIDLGITPPPATWPPAAMGRCAMRRSPLFSASADKYSRRASWNQQIVPMWCAIC